MIKVSSPLRLRLEVASIVADGRNHTPCCRRRNVDAECLELCAYNDATEDTFNLGEHILCALGITEILECFEDGIGQLSSRFWIIQRETVQQNCVLIMFKLQCVQIC